MVLDKNKVKSKPKVSTSKTKLKNNPTEKCSHLYLQEKYLRRIPKLPPSKDLAVIYLYSNEIEYIENLIGFPNLTMLYLQNNRIEKMENLNNLVRLRKLYIGHNKISVLEGLENLKDLEELHIEKQSLPNRDPLCLDPRTILSLSENLCVLNISYNNLSSLSFLSPLKNLIVINASFNDLDDIKDVSQTIQYWLQLREANFTGNPIAKRHRYREDIIANSFRLVTLDGKTVTDVTRKFIKNFETEKLVQGSKPKINFADVVPSLSKEYPLGIQKALSASIIRGTTFCGGQELVFSETTAPYIAWKTLPTRKPLLKTPEHLRNKPKRKSNIEKNTLTVVNSFPKITED